MSSIPAGPLQLVLDAPVDATVVIPGSKSYTNRALVCAALAEGESRIANASVSDDSAHLVAAVRKMGVAVRDDPAAREIVVAGRGRAPLDVDGEFVVGNAGTALRFLTSLACTGRGRAVVTGDERMRQRPIQGLVDALAGLGARVRCARGNGCPPVEVDAAGLPGGRTRMDGSVSSQFLSSLLLAAPAAQGPIDVAVTGALTSRSYVDMTLATMRAFGAEVEADGDARFRVDPARRYRACAYRVEADAAGANYFFALAAATGGRVRVEGLGSTSVQGELRFVDVLRAMGCAVRQGPDWTEVAGPAGGARLKGIDADLNLLPDSAQTLAVLALFAEGPTAMRNVANLRVKETDRIAALAAELRKLGAAVEERADGLVVTPASSYRPAAIETYDDHRMAMSFALAAVRIPGTSIANPRCVAKSFPEFFDVLCQVGVRTVVRQA